MDCKKLALSVGALGVALMGCDGGGSTTTFDARNYQCASGESPPCATDPDNGGVPADSDADRTVEEPNTTEDMTYTFVVETIDIPEAAGGTVAGFNLDGIDSGDASMAPMEATCEEFNPDYINSEEPDHVGVDNALQSLVSTIEGFLDPADCPGMDTAGCLGATLQAQILDGSLILLMQVNGVNDFDYDSSVSLRLFLAEVATGAPPEEGTSGGLAPDQEFNMAMALGDAVEGDIFDGRLRASTPLLTITVDTGDFMLPLMISNAEVRFDISETGLGAGQIGGYLTTSSIVEAASMIMPGIEDVVRTTVQSIADIGPCAEDGQCDIDGDPATTDPADTGICESVSVGLTFGATTAVCTDC